eukprot:781333-Amphidinium_carterae.1
MEPCHILMPLPNKTNTNIAKSRSMFSMSKLSEYTLHRACDSDQRVGCRGGSLVPSIDPELSITFGLHAHLYTLPVFFLHNSR